MTSKRDSVGRVAVWVTDMLVLNAIEEIEQVDNGSVAFVFDGRPMRIDIRCTRETS